MKIYAIEHQRPRFCLDALGSKREAERNVDITSQSDDAASTRQIEVRSLAQRLNFIPVTHVMLANQNPWEAEQSKWKSYY